MALVKGFLKSKPTHDIPKYKILVGVIVGLLMAIYLYSLQYMMRESIRLFSISEDDMWVLTDSEVHFYNLIFAFIASIMGQSFCFEYWFNQPVRSLKARSGRLRSIVHDQRFLNWYFLAWFSKMATMYGFLFCMAGLGWFHLMSFYPEFNYMFVLMVIVLFFQTWNTLLLTFKRRAFKWMLVSLLIISTLSFGLSKLEVINYRALNETVLNKRLDVKYHLRLPKTKVYETRKRRYGRLPNLSLVMSRNRSIRKPFLFINQTRIENQELFQEIAQMKSFLPMELQSFMPVYLKIDKEVPMSYVYQLAKDLAISDVQMLYYLAIPEEAIYDEKYYSSHERTYLPKYNEHHFFYDSKSYMDQLVLIPNRIEIDIDKEGYRIDDVIVAMEHLPKLIQEKVIENLNYAIVLNFQEDINFDVYFGAISSIHEALNKLRDQAAFKGYAMDFKTLEDEWNMKDACRSIKKKYPIKYIEVWDESGIDAHRNTKHKFAYPTID